MKANTNKHARFSDWSALKFDQAPELIEPLSPAAQSKKIEALLNTVNDSSRHVRNFYITLLLASIYIAIIIWSTTDVMLLKETPVTLPLLNAKLPISGFYAFAPYFYLLLHFNLLLQLSLLSHKFYRFDAIVSRIRGTQTQTDYYARLFPFAFTHTLSESLHSGWLKVMLITMVWISIILLPLGVLIGLQIGFLPYHSPEVLLWQRSAIAIDVLFLAIFWPLIRVPDGRWLTWFLRASGLSSLFSLIIRQNKPVVFSVRIMLEGLFGFFTLLAVMVFSLGVAVLPDSDNEKQMAKWISGSVQPSGKKDGQPYFWLTEWLFDRTYLKGNTGKIQKDTIRDSIFHRNLRLREKLLIDSELKPEDRRALWNKKESIRDAVMQKIIGLTLRGRDLRYADFTDSLLPWVDFREVNGEKTDLRYANFNRAMLTKAKMHGVQLQGADLTGAQFQGTNLSGAQFQGTRFFGAQFQGAGLYGAQLQDANLSGVQLQGANLSGVQLQGATLSRAELQGAGLSGAQLQGANLHEVQLQGAYLSRAQLQGANLYGAQLQGANLSRAQLQGADLSRAQLQGANLTRAHLTLSNFTKVIFGKMPEQQAEDLYKEQSQILKHSVRLYYLQERLARATKTSTMLAMATGQNIWIKGSDKVVQKRFKEFAGTLKITVSESDYKNRLTALFIKLSCENTFVASKMIRNPEINWRLLGTSYARCLLSLKDKTNSAGQSTCPGMSEISKENLDILKRRAAIKDPDNKIKPPFKCVAGVSD